MKKRLDELNGMSAGAAGAPSVAVRPSVYQERFLQTMRKVFE